MRVRVNSTYIYHANLLDRIDGRINPSQLQDGDEVKVINLHGAPRANTMGHCYIAKVKDPTVFLGLVSTNSLHTKAEYIVYLKERINELAARARRGGTVGTLEDIR